MVFLWPGSKYNLLISFTYVGLVLVRDCLYCERKVNFILAKFYATVQMEHINPDISCFLNETVLDG